jgi:hypothetical protein
MIDQGKTLDYYTFISATIEFPSKSNTSVPADRVNTNVSCFDLWFYLVCYDMIIVIVSTENLNKQ